MTKRLLVVADLGRFRAYRWEADPAFSHPRLELIEEWETNMNHHLREEVTDQAGRFRKGNGQMEGPAALSDGEQHNLDLERRRRAMKTVAKRISELLETESVEGCYLAADSRINQPILDQIDIRARGRIEKNVSANLSKLSPAELVQHFGG
jgi:hypothetical protein